MVMKKQSKKPPSIKVEIPPYGQMLIIQDDDDDYDALVFFKRNWPQLWPKVFREVKRMYKRCELGVISRSRKWLAYGKRMEPDVFMSDKSDWCLRLDLDPLCEVENGLPVFDFYFREMKIVHCQPVF